MKKIIVPTDFSAYADTAADFAIKIAKEMEAEVHFLHIFSAPVNWKELRPEQEDLYPEIKKNFHNANSSLDHLTKKANEVGVKAERTMLFNEGRNAIDQHINEGIYELVVIGSHGTSGIADVMGSNAQMVIRNSQAPVLVVKNGNKFEDIGKMVYASDFETESFKAFPVVYDLWQLLGTNQLELLYVNTPGNFLETAEIEDLVGEFKKEFPSVEMNVKHYDSLDVERGIVQYAEHNKSSLIALVTHGRRGVNRWFTPSVAENVVNHATVPVLSIKV
ncbi:MAG: universal stress protein [Crocinitomicaceae bacterium]|nr:universal stress protein [Crocinitomicaceae bacterium]